MSSDYAESCLCGIGLKQWAGLSLVWWVCT